MLLHLKVLKVVIGLLEKLLRRSKEIRIIKQLFCEPQMGKRNLYPTLSFRNRNKKVNLMMNFISFCDGRSSLLEIADKLNMPIWDLYSLIDELYSHDLIHSDE